jgi:hypothetical protein
LGIATDRKATIDTATGQLCFYVANAEMLKAREMEQ